jgi:hypothetical protein
MIKLKTVQRPNPKDASAQRKFYVSTQSAGEVTLEKCRKKYPTGVH